MSTLLAILDGFSICDFRLDWYCCGGLDYSICNITDELAMKIEQKYAVPTGHILVVIGNKSME